MTREELIEAIVADQQHKSAYFNKLAKNMKQSHAVFSSSHPEFKARQRLGRRQLKAYYVGNTARLKKLQDVERGWDLAAILSRGEPLSRWDQKLPRGH